MKTVWVLALDRVMDSSLTITLDVLRTAQAVAAQGKVPARFEVRVLGARTRVQTGGGLALRADASFRQALASGDAPHWAIVPAMGEYGGQLATHLALPDAVQAARLLQRLHVGGRTRIGASCASSFLLAEAGLLQQREATTTWWLAGDFRRRYPDVALDERLAKHKDYLERHVAELHSATESAIREYRGAIVDRQQELERLADMAIELFATACVLARTQRLVEERGVAACERELDLCDLFVIESGRRFRTARDSLQSAQDEVRRRVARRVRADGGYGVVDATLEAGE